MKLLRSMAQQLIVLHALIDQHQRADETSEQCLYRIRPPSWVCAMRELEP
jgi:hypothetical protein